ncbi:Prolipoprotein diacylglyceryl transferase [Fulvivirga imtechensis AK7]|uniref:Prolipoprotein diacylglyceryl transferase n=2 Tax=Fulvivirga TaxID=396811 RepID=L8JXJ2_9BACT|nr:Prolipoprotein diacylglyceryl transferase [Fulvivirga imtechensis AK7]
MFYIYRKEGKPERDVETLTIYMVIATILGARLGHVLFYEPEKYLANPIDILKIWEGGLASHGAAFGILFALWVYVNYYIKINLNPFSKPKKRFAFKKHKREHQSYLQVVDRIVIVVALAGCLIRLGNFMNSEIYGIPTQSEYGVVFVNNATEAFAGYSSPIDEIDYKKDGGRALSEQGYVPIELAVKFKNEPEILNEQSITQYLTGKFKNVITDYAYVSAHIYHPENQELDYKLSQNPDGSYTAIVKVYGIARHPTQLYEAATSFLIFVLLLLLWLKYKNETPQGLLLGLFLILLFGLRFVHELFKENQVAFEDEMTYNMGQILSIPLIIAGVLILYRAISKGRYKEKEQNS